MKLLDLLRGAKPATSAQLREALASATLDRLQQRRAELLVDGTERDLDAVEADVRSAQRQLDRLDLLTIQAEARLRDAEAAERQAELDELFAEGEKLVAEGVDLIRRRYPPLAKRLLELAERLRAIDGEVAALNRALAEAGDPRRVRDFDREARPVEPAPPLPLPRQRFWSQLELPSASEWHRLLWPTTDAFGRPLTPAEGGPER
jgi:hypothetical protein